MELEWDFGELEAFGKRLESTAKFYETATTCAHELAKVLHKMLRMYTPKLTGNLKAGWSRGNNLMFEVMDLGEYYQVTLTNLVEYASSVNDGHRSFNQFGGPYGFVPGRFFVEKAIVETQDKAESTIYRELKKWWEWCLNG